MLKNFHVNGKDWLESFGRKVLTTMSKNVILKMKKSKEKGIENMKKLQTLVAVTHTHTHTHNTFSEINKTTKIKNKGKIAPICNFT